MSSSRAPLLCVWIASALAITAAAEAQPQPGPLPPGPGVVTGRVVHPAGPAAAAGVPVVLYALSSSGEPGVANAVSDEQGRFAFEGVSNDPGMAYLVGARYRDIPFFGPRVVFVEGRTETNVIVDVSEPTSDASGVGVREVLVQFEWVAGRLAVQEIHRLRSAGSSVVVVDEALRESTPAPFETRLPEGAGDFASLTTAFDDQIEEHDGRVRYWGPIYPGGQDLHFQYTLPIAGPQTPVVLSLPMGTDGLSVLTRAGGPRVAEAGELGAPQEIELEGNGFRVRRLANVARGAQVGFSIALPAASSDMSRIGIDRADAWIEYDDVQLSVNLQTLLVVDGDQPIAGTDQQPLLRIPLPDGAEGVELTGLADEIGAVERDGAVLVYGPVGPGESPFSVRFLLAPTPQGIAFDLRYPIEVKLLNVLVADTGIAIESERLHRRRPFRQGTRVYLHREAFHLTAGEVVRVGLRPLQRSRLGSRISLGLSFAGLVVCAFFVAQPLIRVRSTPRLPEETALSIRREALYEAIRDLDHDMETGKLAESDHREMREALRARAVELLRAERDGATALAVAPTPGCPQCGGRIETSWTFCSGCGAKLGGVG